MSGASLFTAVWLGAKRLEAIVIGGSAGSLEALRLVLSGLPSAATLPIAIPVIVVVHLPARPVAELPNILQPASTWPMKQAEDKEPVAGGTVYFAPADYHLLIEKERRFSLSMDEPEHFSRPSIGVLFESACETYSAQLLGVLLSGASADGAAGLAAIHTAGGQTVVQTPESAGAKVMPLAALDLFEPTLRLDPAGIRNLFASLTA